MIAARMLGVELHLLPERAVWDPATGTVYVADLHAGKDESLRAAGLPIPPGPLGADLDRLRTLVASLDARRLVILGDFLHARRGRTPEVSRELQRWRRRLSRTRVVLVRGNHDRAAGDPGPELDVDVVEEGTRDGRLHLVHDPDGADPPDGLVLAGHLHPAVRLGPGVRTPAFWLRGSTLVLPAFSEFTSGVPILPDSTDRCWAVAPPEVIPLPTAGLRARR